MESLAPKTNRKRLILAFWLAVGVSVLLHFAQPYGRYALYPFTYLSTWVHEMGHGLTAILTGGEFRELVMLPDGGYAVHAGSNWFTRPLVSAGGLLGPAIAGAFMIVLGAKSERTARGALYVLAASLVISLAVWIRTPYGLGIVGALAAVLVLVAWKGNEFLKLVVTQLLGIQFCLGSFSDFDYMFTKNFERGGKLTNSDTQNIAESLLLPYWFWGGLIAALSLLILGVAFYVAWIRPLSEEGASGAGRAAGDDLDLDPGPLAQSPTSSGDAEDILRELSS